MFVVLVVNDDANVIVYIEYTIGSAYKVINNLNLTMLISNVLHIHDKLLYLHTKQLYEYSKKQRPYTETDSPFRGNYLPPYCKGGKQKAPYNRKGVYTTALRKRGE